MYKPINKKYFKAKCIFQELSSKAENFCNRDKKLQKRILKVKEKRILSLVVKS